MTNRYPGEPAHGVVGAADPDLVDLSRLIAELVHTACSLHDQTISASAWESSAFRVSTWISCWSHAQPALTYSWPAKPKVSQFCSGLIAGTAYMCKRALSCQRCLQERLPRTMTGMSNGGYNFHPAEGPTPELACSDRRVCRARAVKNAWFIVDRTRPTQPFSTLQQRGSRRTTVRGEPRGGRCPP